MIVTVFQTTIMKASYTLFDFKLIPINILYNADTVAVIGRFIGLIQIPNRYYLIISIFCLSTINSIGQTKLISHKSHSGSNKSFVLAMKTNNSSIKESNFGMAPQRFVRNSKLDSVILLSDNVAIMITSETCHSEEYDNPRDRSSKSLWSAGRDTVFNHPVFTTKNSIKDIKNTLKQDYYFANSIDSVVFIGFDGDFQKENPKLASNNKATTKGDVAKEDEKDERSPRRPKSFFLIFLISIYSAIFNRPF